MKRGSRERGCRGLEVEVKVDEGGDEYCAETRLIMSDILSSSSGQMSGQWVKPK